VGEKRMSSLSQTVMRKGEYCIGVKGGGGVLYGYGIDSLPFSSECGDGQWLSILFILLIFIIICPRRHSLLRFISRGSSRALSICPSFSSSSEGVDVIVIGERPSVSWSYSCCSLRSAPVVVAGRRSCCKFDTESLVVIRLLFLLPRRHPSGRDILVLIVLKLGTLQRILRLVRLEELHAMEVREMEEHLPCREETKTARGTTEHWRLGAFLWLHTRLLSVLAESHKVRGHVAACPADQSVRHLRPDHLRHSRIGGRVLLVLLVNVHVCLLVGCHARHAHARTLRRRGCTRPVIDALRSAS
ncbi:hypothetical protein PENTCL1PPCAC_13121, partial [Pristionchus entomophagus]